MTALPTAPSRRTTLPAAAVGLEGVRVERGGRATLVDVDLSVLPGRLTVLAGPNGAGKSTLLEVLGGLLPPAAGTVRRDAVATAFVPQRAAVSDRLPVTVRDVVTMGLWGETGPWRRVGRDGRRRVDSAIDDLGLTALSRRPFATLSGGERQRAILAQSLARRADLLLLDEPTTGLDAHNCRHVVEAMVAEAARGVAVVCVSHDTGVIATADCVVRLDAGRIVAEEHRH